MIFFYSSHPLPALHTSHACVETEKKYRPVVCSELTVLPNGACDSKQKRRKGQKLSLAEGGCTEWDERTGGCCSLVLLSTPPGQGS